MTDNRVEKKHSLLREIVEWAVTLGLAVVLALSVHTWVGQLVIVDGPSMQPNLHTGELVLTGKIEYYFNHPKRGDIVVVRFPNDDRNYIKRVIATENETVSISGGSVYIDGKRLNEPYIPEPIIEDMEPHTVPADSIFVMGDNRNDSSDSRLFGIGSIPMGQVVGRAYALVWPIGKFSRLTGYTGAFEP